MHVKARRRDGAKRQSKKISTSGSAVLIFCKSAGGRVARFLKLIPGP